MPFFQKSRAEISRGMATVPGENAFCPRDQCQLFKSPGLFWSKRPVPIVKDASVFGPGDWYQLFRWPVLLGSRRTVLRVLSDLHRTANCQRFRNLFVVVQINANG